MYIFHSAGITSVILSTIETRYRFRSVLAGLIAVTFDSSVALSVVFISYFGGKAKAHKPRWLGFSLIIQGIGAFVFATPQLFFSPYTPNIGIESPEICNLTAVPLAEPCETENGVAYAIFLLGNVLIGIGAAPLFTIGTAFLDEIIYPKYVSIHIGIFYAMAVVGPALGYGMGSAFLNIYVDPLEDTNLNNSDPSFVGAWWIPFVLAGFISIFLSIPFFFYPRELPESADIRKERAKENAFVSNQQTKEKTLVDTLKLFPRQLKDIVTNLSFMFITGAHASIFIVVSGLVAFAPKYFESQFGLSPSLSGIIVGAISIPSAG